MSYEPDTHRVPVEDSPDPLFATIFRRARPYLQTRNNESHTRISYGWAVRLLQQGGDPAVVIPAILLHDVGWSRVPETSQLEAMRRHARQPGHSDVHEREGARIAAEILDAVGYPAELHAPILAIIAEHDSKQSFDSPEEAIVKDADKLYRYSPEAMVWFREHAAMGPQAYLALLKQFTEGWFLTSLGRRLAAEQLAARQAEWRENSTTST